MLGTTWRLALHCLPGLTRGTELHCPHGGRLETCLYLLSVAAATHPHALVIKTTRIYYLVVLRVRSQKWAKGQGASGVHSIPEALVRSISLPCPSSRGCPHSLACGSFLHLQSCHPLGLSSAIFLTGTDPSASPSPSKDPVITLGHQDILGYSFNHKIS